MSGNSPKQLEANKRNARRSTGPRTPAGKARVKFNALRHGLLAKSVILPIRSRSEKRSHFDALLAQLIDELKPVGILEDMLVEKIAVSYWRLRRSLRVRLRRTKSATTSAIPVVISSPSTPQPSPFLPRATPSRSSATKMPSSVSSIGLLRNCNACKNTVAFPRLTPRRHRLSTKIKNYQTNPLS